MWDPDCFPILYTFLRLERHRRILDVGSGLGDLSRRLARHAKPETRVYGIDLDASFVRSAAGKARREKLPITYRTMDAAAMTFADNTFDLTVAMTLFINLVDPDQVLAEMIRVTAPDGLVAAIEPINQVDGYNEYMPGFTESEYRFMMNIARRKRETFQFVPAAKRFIAPRLPHIFAGAGLVDVAVKSFGYAHTQRWTDEAYADYLRWLRQKVDDIDSGRLTAADVRKNIAPAKAGEASRYLKITRRRATRILKRPQDYAHMIYTNVHQLLVVRGRKGKE